MTIKLYNESLAHTTQNKQQDINIMTHKSQIVSKQHEWIFKHKHWTYTRAVNKDLHYRQVILMT